MAKPSARPYRTTRPQIMLLLGFQCPMLVNGIVKYAGEARWALELSYIRVGSVPAEWRGDGIVGLITNPRDYEALQPFIHLPIVDLSMSWIRHFPPKLRRAGLKVPRVSYDNRAIARLAAAHLLERGFKNIAFFNYSNYWFEAERIAAFRPAVEEGGGHFHEIDYQSQYCTLKPRPGQSRSQADRWLVERLRSLPKPLGIWVPADDLAHHIFSACADAGLMVPEEVAVLGCDNDPILCDFSIVPLSSVATDWETMGYEAARLLDGILHGRKPPREPILIPPTGVVTRMSTNIMAVPHPKVARALRHIWDHFREPIQIPDVARIAGLTRRGLEKAFERHMDRTIAEEITHCRIEHATRLLLDTDLKAHEIAEQSGFSSIFHFSQTFLRVAGLRPSHFRQLHAAGAKGRDSHKVQR